MDWKQYEKEIHAYFKDTYKDSRILYDQKVLGIYSKEYRQIDILIEHYVAGMRIRIIVDSKYYSSNIDVKDVETFLSMVEDVEATNGIIITTKGYSTAAMNRAYYGPRKVELDILNFDELKHLQGFEAIPYAGDFGVIIPAPFGWIIDATRRDGILACLYQRGATFEQAFMNRELIYINTWQYDNSVTNLDELIKFQEEVTQHYSPKATFKYQHSINRLDNAKTILRYIEGDQNGFQEYTGFIEFEGFCLFCVLLTPEVLSTKNIRKLEFVLERALPIMIDQESILSDILNQADEALDAATDSIEKAEIYIFQGDQLKARKHYDRAIEKYNASIKFLMTSYGALKGKVECYLALDNSSTMLTQAIDSFFNLAPTNPTICSDLMEMFFKRAEPERLVLILQRQIERFNSNEEAKGNLTFHLGLLYLNLEQSPMAKEYFTKAREHFKKSLPEDHSVFESIVEGIAQCRKKGNRKQ